MLLPSFSRFLAPFCVLLSGAPWLISPAQALPTLNPLPGITGLSTIPTADSVAPGHLESSISYERVKIREGSGHVDFLPLFSLNLGLKRGEIGATYEREDSSIEGFSTRNSFFAAQGKFRVYERENLGVAVGAHYLDFGSDGADLGSALSGYATVSYTLRGAPNDGEVEGSPAARYHAGLLLQRVRGSGQSETALRPFGGAEFFLRPAVSVAADYLSSDQSAARAFSFSLRYSPPEAPLSAQIGVGKLRRDTRFFVGLSYAFGRRE